MTWFFPLFNLALFCARLNWNFPNRQFLTIFNLQSTILHFPEKGFKKGIDSYSPQSHLKAMPSYKSMNQTHKN